MALQSYRKIKVAIDGPAGAGKSTIARLVAARLAYIYVDTGAMYRAITWYALEHGVDSRDAQAIAALLRDAELKLVPAPEGQQVMLNGADVTGLLRSANVNANVSQVSQIAEVRQKLTAMQRALAEAGAVVMDGRDIGTQVMPDAELKIYLTATVEERARRRQRELNAAGERIELDTLQSQIAARDDADRNRAISPLKQAEDAIYIDSSDMTIEQVVERIVQLSSSLIGEAGATSK